MVGVNARNRKESDRRTSQLSRSATFFRGEEQLSFRLELLCLTEGSTDLGMRRVASG